MNSKKKKIVDSHKSHTRKQKNYNVIYLDKQVLTHQDLKNKDGGTLDHVRVSKD